MKKSRIVFIMVLLTILTVGFFVSCFFLIKGNNLILGPNISEGNVKSDSENVSLSEAELQVKEDLVTNVPGNEEDMSIDVSATGGLDTQGLVSQSSVVTSVIESVTAQVINSKAQSLMNDFGIFSDYYEEAYQKMINMSLDEKIGQVLLVRVPDGDAKAVVESKQFGGYILFGRDTENQTSEQLQATIQSWNDVSKNPLIIATDEEGGSVVRVSSNANLVAHRFPSSQELYEMDGYDAIVSDTFEKNRVLFNLGINVNLAPVADVSTNCNDYIFDRSFGKNAIETAEYIKTVISISKNTGVSNVLKHFPGYGNNVDTHTGISIDNRSLESFCENDFLPFISGINEGAEAILVSHNIITDIDDSVPASLSKGVHNILRDELGFTGVVMTDDLAMEAVNSYVSKPSVEALRAGNDMIIISDYESGISDLREALENGELDEEILDKAVIRVLAWKLYKGLFD